MGRVDRGPDPALLASADEESAVWFYPALSKTPIDLPNPVDSKGRWKKDQQRTLSVARVDDSARLFGVGLDRTLFEGLDELTIAAVEFRIAEGLRRDIGEEAIVDGVDIAVDGPAGELRLSIRYRRRTDRRPRNLEITL